MGAVYFAACKEDFKCDIDVGKISTLREEENTF